MELKLTEQLPSNTAIDALASALIALPGGEAALTAAIAAAAEASQAADQE